MVCPDWVDPRNVGAAFRLSDAAGLSGLLLGGTTPCPPHSKLAKTARATEKSVAWQHIDDLPAYLEAQKAAGALVLALEITDESQDLLSYQLTENRPVYLIAGSESHGVDQSLLDCCDAAVHLPMYGQNSSMNVAVAMGAAVYLLLGQL